MAKIAEDLPHNVREIWRTILIPVLKKVRESECTKTMIIGDRLLANGKMYTFNKILIKWRSDVDGTYPAQGVSSPPMSGQTRQAQEV